MHKYWVSLQTSETLGSTRGRIYKLYYDKQEDEQYLYDDHGNNSTMYIVLDGYFVNSEYHRRIQFCKAVRLMQVDGVGILSHHNLFKRLLRYQYNVRYCKRNEVEQ